MDFWTVYVCHCLSWTWCLKSIVLRLVSMWIVKPISSNTLIMILSIRSICWPFTFHNMSSSSSIYRQQSFLLISLRKTEIRTSLHTSVPSKLPIVTSKQLSVWSFFHASLLLNSNNLRQCFIDCRLFRHHGQLKQWHI